MRRIFLISIFAVLISVPLFSLNDVFATGGEIHDSPSCSAIGGTWDSSTNTCTAGSLVVNSGETLHVAGTFVTLKITGTIDNSGTIFNDGTIINDGIINNNPGGTLINNGGATIHNSGTINDYCGGSFNNNFAVVSGFFSGNQPVNLCDGTTVTIPPHMSVDFGTMATFTATVADTTNPSSISPGTVSWSTNAGTFNPTSCDLASGTCSVLYTAPNTVPNLPQGSATVTVKYGGDSTHQSSLGSFQIPIIGDIHDGNSCQLVGGTWDSSTSTCTVSNLDVGLQKTYGIARGVTLVNTGLLFIDIQGILFNDGTVINKGQIAIEGGLNNVGTIDNHCGGTTSGTVSGNQPTSECLPVVTISPKQTSTFPGNNLAFTATVTDTSNSPTIPEGTVTWNDGAAGGTFSNSGSCSLSGSGSSSSCNIQYTAPSSAGSITITGSYGGDSKLSANSDTSSLSLQTTTTISDQNSCESLGGSWTPGSNSQASTCAITSNITIGSGDTLNIDSNIDLQINPGVTLANSGTINNSNSNSFINDLGTIVNDGTINDNFVLIVHGQLTNNGAINVNGNELEVYGTLDNKGHVVFTSGSDLFNTGTITNECGSDISGTYNLLSGSNQPVNQVCDTIPPTLTISEPSDNAVLDHLLSVNGTASDDTSVSSVTGKMDNGITSVATTTDNFAHWSFATTGISTGSHTIEINATDSGGLVTTQSVSITINDCQSGTYLSGNQCVQAPPGSYVGTTGATSATQCTPGSYQPNTGQTSCILADIGYFVSSSGAIQETQCPQYTTSDTAGSTSCRALSSTEQTNNLINSVNGMHLDQGIASSLDGKLNSILSSLNSNQNNAAKNQLNAFINEVNAQTGKKITPSEAITLIPAVQHIINSIQ